MLHTTHPHLMTFLWLLPMALEIAIVLIMISRGLWRGLPIFFAYVIAEIGRTAFLFVERKNVYVYFYGYWVTEIIGCFMALWVCKELFDNVFSRYLGLRSLGRVLFKGSLLVVIVSAVLFSRVIPEMDTARILAAILVIKRAVTFVQAGMLASLFLFGLFLGLAWDRYVIGVALGFGIYGAGELVAITARTIYGRAAESPCNWIMMGVGNCCVLIWISYFLFPPKARDNLEIATPDNRMLQGWNDALVALMRNPLHWLHGRRLSS